MSDLGQPKWGILWMLATGLMFAVQNGVVRYLGDDLPALQSAFIRFVWGIALLAPMLPKLRLNLPRAALMPLVFRGAFHAAAVVLWFYAVVHIPLAQVTAIGYLNPVLMLVLGAMLMGEALPARRIAVVAMALIGALIVLRPGFQPLTAGHFAQIGAALAFCGSYLLAKHLSASVDASVIVAMMSLVVSVLLAPLAYAVWQPVTFVEVLWLGVVALAATGGHYAMTRAFAAAPLAVTQPVTFLQLVWVSLIGMTLFDEPLDGYVLLGGGLIIAAISWLAWHEHRASAGVARAALD
ncbi:MAG: DMT family transporter [Cypionkella sp.]|nr:DMT family transporter [Cypionkella sp.]